MIPFGELPAEQHDQQATAFIRLYDRNPSGDWRSDFSRWAGQHGKDFHPGDAWAIATRVNRRMVAGGATTLTDPFDFLHLVDPEEDAA